MNCQTIKKQHARRELLYHQKNPLRSLEGEDVHKLLRKHAASGVERISVVALDADALAWRWCMDVLTIADVDANVVWACAAPEYEVTRLQRNQGNLLHNSDLIVGGTRQADAVLSENILHKAAAVEAGRGGAAKPPPRRGGMPVSPCRPVPRAMRKSTVSAWSDIV